MILILSMNIGLHYASPEKKNFFRTFIPVNRIAEMAGVHDSDMLGKDDYEYTIPFHRSKRPLLMI